MKIILKCLPVLILTCTLLGNSQNLNSFIPDSKRNDTLTPLLKKKFEEKLATITQAKLFDINETLYVESFLNTREDIRAFITTAVQIKFPEFKHPKALDILIGDDDSNKLWFVLVKPPYVGHGGALFIIVAKNNCRIVYYERTK